MKYPRNPYLAGLLALLIIASAGAYALFFIHKEERAKTSDASFSERQLPFPIWIEPSVSDVPTEPMLFTQGPLNFSVVLPAGMKPEEVFKEGVDGQTYYLNAQGPMMQEFERNLAFAAPRNYIPRARGGFYGDITWRKGDYVSLEELCEGSLADIACEVRTNPQGIRYVFQRGSLDMGDTISTVYVFPLKAVDEDWKLIAFTSISMVDGDASVASIADSFTYLK